MIKALFKKLFGTKTKAEQEIESKDELIIKDNRKVKTNLNAVNMAQEDDPIMSAMLNAAWSGKSSIGSVNEKGELTITDAQTSESDSGQKD
jgi:hypothetical protein